MQEKRIEKRIWIQSSKKQVKTGKSKKMLESRRIKYNIFLICLLSYLNIFSFFLAFYLILIMFKSLFTVLVLLHPIY
jgi:hypothetical protein